MTNEELLHHLDALLANVDPATGVRFAADSALADHRVSSALARLRKTIAAQPLTENDIPGLVLEAASREVRSLGYSPTVAQLLKVLLGSRSVVDAELRGLPCFGRYRGKFTRREMKDFLVREAASRPELIDATPVRKSRKKGEWESVEFFTAAPFDQLDADRAADLTARVAALPLKKSGSSLPAFIAVLREKEARSFEPWTREERALLVEAMCFTNDGEKLSRIFGRSLRAVESEGKKLIWENRQSK